MPNDFYHAINDKKAFLGNPFATNAFRSNPFIKIQLTVNNIIRLSNDNDNARQLYYQLKNTNQKWHQYDNVNNIFIACLTTIYKQFSDNGWLEKCLKIYIFISTFAYYTGNIDNDIKIHSFKSYNYVILVRSPDMKCPIIQQYSYLGQILQTW